MDFRLREAQTGGVQTGEEHHPFDLPGDYARHVDGKLRLDGVRSFLTARGIDLPEGTADDGPDAHTVHGLGGRKNALVREVLATQGVGRYDASIAYVEAVRDAGLRRGVVSASRNCAAVLEAAGIADLFEVRVDGVVAAERGLPGKPAPDLFLAAAAALDVSPEQAAVFEDAVAGVAAGRAGGFGGGGGVDRQGHADELLRQGADVVVQDLAELREPN